MAAALPHVAAPQASAPVAVRDIASEDQRWAAWRAKGIAHDEAVRRRLAIVGPIFLAVAAIVVYALVAR